MIPPWVIPSEPGIYLKPLHLGRKKYPGQEIDEASYYSGSWDGENPGPNNAGGHVPAHSRKPIGRTDTRYCSGDNMGGTHWNAEIGS